MEKQPRAAPNEWFAQGESDPTMTEVLFMALLLVACDLPDDGLQKWAQQVAADGPRAEALGVAWQPLTIDEHRTRGFEGSKGKSKLWSPLEYVFMKTVWSNTLLDTIGAGVSLWHGDGCWGNLTHSELRQHLNRSKPRLGVRPNKKDPAPPRWRTWSVVRVADLIDRRFGDLKKAVKLDVATAEVSSPFERIEAQTARADAAEAQRDEARKARDKAQNAYRKASLQNKEKTQIKRDAVKEARAASKRQRDERLAEERVKSQKRLEAAAEKAKAEKAALKESLAQRREQMEEELAAQCEQMEVEVEESREAKEKELQAEYKDKFETQRKGLNKAREEKRDAQEARDKAQRKVARLEKKVAGLEEEEARGESDPMDVEMESEEEEESSPPRPRNIGFELMPRRDEKGRWQAESEELRALRHAQLGRGVASSKVAQNIADVISLIAPDAEMPSPCERQMRRMRGEVTLTSDMMAAWKFAIAKRIMCFGWDESTKFGNSVFGCFAQLEHFDGRVEDICLRGLSILPDGGTSAAVLNHIETRILAHSRRMLTLWKKEFERSSGCPGSWAAAGGPDPENIGLHRLAEDTVLMSDTCNGARCTKRMLGEAIMKVIEERVGKAAWEAMSPEERDRKYKVYRGDCWQHLRNIIIGAMAETGNNLVKEAVADSLDLFSSFERIDPSGSSVIRSAFKQFHHGGEYALGRGREFEVWRKLKFESALFVSFERALGSRQDLAFDGCVPLFMNRVICLGFLRGYIDCPKSENVLDKSLYTLLRCNEFVALLRAHALWKFIFSEPFRWLSGKTSKLEGMSLIKMGEVLEHVEKAMEKIAEDPVRSQAPVE